MSHSHQTHAREIADALGNRDSEVQLAELAAERAKSIAVGGVIRDMKPPPTGQDKEIDMAEFCSETLKAIRRLYEAVDGAHRIEVKAVSEHVPKGEAQDCVLATGEVEWVDYHGPGMAGDNFWGTVTWRLGDHYLIAHFAT